MQNHRSKLVPAVLLGALACLLPVADADAAAVWPSGPWEPLTIGGSDYWDDLSDESPDATDLVGGFDVVSSNSFTAGFLHESETGPDQISLRMRLDGDGSSGAGANSVWQFLFETDGDLTSIDWVLEVRQSGPPSAQQVIFTQASPGGATFGDVSLSTSFSWTGALADWRRWTPVTDGSSFDGDADYFLDVAMPLSVFRSVTGLSATDSYLMALSTSTSHTQINKDLPLGLAPTQGVNLGFTGPVPEPSTGMLLALGLCYLAYAARSPER